MRFPWSKPKINTTDIEGIIVHVFLDMLARKVRKDHRNTRKNPGQFDSFVSQVFETFKANHPGFYREEYKEPLGHLAQCFVSLEAIERN